MKSTLITNSVSRNEIRVKYIIPEQAILDLSDCTVMGDPTYVRGRHGNMGALEVYHYQYGKYDSLDRSAYLHTAQLTRDGQFIDYPLESWKWDIKESNEGELVIQALVNERSPRCQLRIQFFTFFSMRGNYFEYTK